MEIKLMIDAPELAQALTSLAGAFQANTELLLQSYSRPDMMARTSPAAEPAAAEPAEAAPEAEAPENVVTLADVRVKMTALGRAGRQNDIKNLLSGFGASKLTEVDPARLPELWAAMEVL